MLLGNGDGTFGAAESFAAGDSGIGGAADYDADGDIDISVTDPISGFFAVLLNEGVSDTDWNGFSRPSFRMQVGISPQDVVSGDWDSDGDADLVVGSATDVFILLNNGTPNGEWEGFTKSHQYAAGDHSSNVRAGHFDADGDLDIVVGNWISGDVTLLLGRGDGSFDEIGNFKVGDHASTSDRAVEVADLNGDGNSDVAVAIWEQPKIAVLYGDGAGDFAEPIELEVSRSVAGVRNGDFDNDDDVDLIAFNDNSIHTLVNNGDGTFLEQENGPGGSSTRTGAVVADFDADGRLDLAVATSLRSAATDCGVCGVEVFLNETIVQVDRLPGDADENGAVDFSDFLLLSANFGSTDAVWGQGDFNADGRVTFEDFLVLSENFGKKRPIGEILSSSAEAVSAAVVDQLFTRFDEVPAEDQLTVAHELDTADE